MGGSGELDRLPRVFKAERNSLAAALEYARIFHHPVLRTSSYLCVTANTSTINREKSLRIKF